MDFEGVPMDIVGLVSVISIFVVLPGIIFFTSYMKKKARIELEKIQYQKEILELEIQKNETSLKMLEEENRKYDRLING
jgi:hypothetical protein